MHVPHTRITSYQTTAYNFLCALRFPMFNKRTYYYQRIYKTATILLLLLLTADDAKMIASAVVGARQDYCLYGCLARNLDRLQKLQYHLLRVVLCLPWSASATDARRQLHWLPIKQRIDYKILQKHLGHDKLDSRRIFTTKPRTIVQ